MIAYQAVIDVDINVESLGTFEFETRLRRIRDLGHCHRDELEGDVLRIGCRLHNVQVRNES